MYSNEKHVYDIDLKLIWSKLVDLKPSRKNSTGYLRSKELFEIQSTDLLNEWNVSKHDYNRHAYFLITSDKNVFFDYLAYDLLFRDQGVIKLLLDYHTRNFKGNYYAKTPLDFIGVVKFTILPKLHKLSFVNASKQIKAVTDWIREHENKVLPITTIPEDSRVFLSSEDLQSLMIIMHSYFSEKDKKKFEILLTGSPIEGKITFISSANKLCHAFLRLQKQKKIKVTVEQLAKWIAHYFDYSFNRVRKPITYSYAINLLSKKEYYCKNPIPAIVEWLGA